MNHGDHGGDDGDDGGDGDGRYGDHGDRGDDGDGDGDRTESCFFSRKCHGLRIFQYMMAGKANISGEEK